MERFRLSLSLVTLSFIFVFSSVSISSAQESLSEPEVVVPPQPEILEYKDVANSHPYYEAIQYVQKFGINGYDDGTFRPNAPINRAEFSKIAALIKYSNVENFSEPCFHDLNNADWFLNPVCTLKQKTILNGYPDGNFKPANFINFAEASKILSRLFELPMEHSADNNEPWYLIYFRALDQKKAVPASIQYANQFITRGEMVEMIWRLHENIENKTSADLENVSRALCEKIPSSLPANIDLDRIRSTWLSWYNQKRSELNLQPYVYNKQLERTSIIWSEEAKKRGYIDHKRSSPVYYDYREIKDWFKNLGIAFQNGAFSENIAWNVYSCNKADCTDDLISAIRTGFDFFLHSGPHYEAIVHPDYRLIGLGISIDPAKRKFYLTTHIGKEIASDPLPICP